MKTQLGIFLVCLIGCQQKPSQPAPLVAQNENNAMTQEMFIPEKEGYALIWEDHFEGAELDTTKWSVRGVGPRRIGYNSASTVKVKDGYLHLIYDIVEDSILGSAVGTYEKFDTHYGYFECRAKLQSTCGPWAAFWLQSPLISQGEDPGEFGTEIDVFEYFKEIGSDTLTHAIHWAYGPNMVSVGPMKSALPGLDNGFHTFALEWTPDKYAFFIDGLRFHEQKVGISHIDQYMILSMELPSKLENIKQAYAPDTFSVDYVKVYQKADL